MDPLIVNLNTWIDSLGPGQAGIDTAAGLLGASPRTVVSWYRQERAPCFRAAFAIVTASSGLVDYNGIFKPLELGQVPGVRRAMD